MSLGVSQLPTELLDQQFRSTLSKLEVDTKKSFNRMAVSAESSFSKGLFKTAAADSRALSEALNPLAIDLKRAADALEATGIKAERANKPLTDFQRAAKFAAAETKGLIAEQKTGLVTQDQTIKNLRELATSLGQQLGAADKAEAGYEQFARAAVGAADAADKLEQSQRRAQAVFNADDVRRYRDAISNLRTSYEAGEIGQQRFIDDTYELDRQIRELRAQFSNTSKEAGALGRVLGTASRGVQTATGSMSRLGLSQQVAIGSTNALNLSLKGLGPAGTASALGISANGAASVQASRLMAGFGAVATTTQTRLNALALSARGLAASFLPLAGIAGAAGIVKVLESFAAEANQARLDAELFTVELDKAGISAQRGQQALGGLTDTFRVADADIQGAATGLLRYGAELDAVKGLLTIGGASALAAGKSAAAGFEAVEQAIISESSEALNRIGIAGNLSTAFERQADALGKSVDELSNAEKAQAAYLYLQKETASEIAAIPTLLSGYGGAVNDLAVKWAELRREVGEKVVVAFTTGKQAMVEALDVFLQPGNGLESGKEDALVLGNVMIELVRQVGLAGIEFTGFATQVIGTFASSSTALKLFADRFRGFQDTFRYGFEAFVARLKGKFKEAERLQELSAQSDPFNLEALEDIAIKAFSTYSNVAGNAMANVQQNTDELNTRLDVLKANFNATGGEVATLTNNLTGITDPINETGDGADTTGEKLSGLTGELKGSETAATDFIDTLSQLNLTDTVGEAAAQSRLDLEGLRGTIELNQRALASDVDATETWGGVHKRVYGDAGAAATEAAKLEQQAFFDRAKSRDAIVEANERAAESASVYDDAAQTVYTTQDAAIGQNERSIASLRDVIQAQEDWNERMELAGDSSEHAAHGLEFYRQSLKDAADDLAAVQQATDDAAEAAEILNSRFDSEGTDAFMRSLARGEIAQFAGDAESAGEAMALLSEAGIVPTTYHLGLLTDEFGALGDEAAASNQVLKDLFGVTGQDAELLGAALGSSLETASGYSDSLAEGLSESAAEAEALKTQFSAVEGALSSLISGDPIGAVGAIIGGVAQGFIDLFGLAGKEAEDLRKETEKIANEALKATDAYYELTKAIGSGVVNTQSDLFDTKLQFAVDSGQINEEFAKIKQAKIDMIDAYYDFQNAQADIIERQNQLNDALVAGTISQGEYDTQNGVLAGQLAQLEEGLAYSVGSYLATAEQAAEELGLSQTELYTALLSGDDAVLGQLGPGATLALTESLQAYIDTFGALPPEMQRVADELGIAFDPVAQGIANGGQQITTASQTAGANSSTAIAQYTNGLLAALGPAAQPIIDQINALYSSQAAAHTQGGGLTSQATQQGLSAFSLQDYTGRLIAQFGPAAQGIVSQINALYGAQAGAHGQGGTLAAQGVSSGYTAQSGALYSSISATNADLQYGKTQLAGDIYSLYSAQQGQFLSGAGLVGGSIGQAADAQNVNQQAAIKNLTDYMRATQKGLLGDIGLHATDEAALFLQGGKNVQRAFADTQDDKAEVVSQNASRYITFLGGVATSVFDAARGVFDAEAAGFSGQGRPASAKKQSFADFSKWFGNRVSFGGDKNYETIPDEGRGGYVVEDPNETKVSEPKKGSISYADQKLADLRDRYADETDPKKRREIANQIRAIEKQRDKLDILNPKPPSNNYNPKIGSPGKGYKAPKGGSSYKPPKSDYKAPKGGGSYKPPKSGGKNDGSTYRGGKPENYPTGSPGWIQAKINEVEEQIKKTSSKTKIRSLQAAKEKLEAQLDALLGNTRGGASGTVDKPALKGSIDYLQEQIQKEQGKFDSAINDAARAKSAERLKILKAELEEKQAILRDAEREIDQTLGNTVITIESPLADLSSIISLAGAAAQVSAAIGRTASASAASQTFSAQGSTLPAYQKQLDATEGMDSHVSDFGGHVSRFGGWVTRLERIASQQQRPNSNLVDKARGQSLSVFNLTR